MIKSSPTAMLLTVMLSITIPVQAKIYKWVDDQGNIHYTQTPPLGGKTEVIHTRPDPKDASQAGARLQQQLEEFDKRYEARVKAEQERKTVQQHKQVKQVNCAAAKQNLSTLQNRGRIKIREGDTYRRLTEEERQTKINEAKKQIGEFCIEAQMAPTDLILEPLK